MLDQLRCYLVLDSWRGHPLGMQVSGQRDTPCGAERHEKEEVGVKRLAERQVGYAPHRGKW